MACILRSYDEDYFEGSYHKKDHGKKKFECKEFDKKHDYDYKRGYRRRYDDDYERDYRRRYVLKDHDRKHDFDCECKKDHDRKHDFDCECKKDHDRKHDFDCECKKDHETKHDFDCECKKNHDRKDDWKDQGKKVVDFECDVVKPNIFVEGSTRTIRIGEEVVVASVTFEKLKKDAEVLLNGLVHVAMVEGDAGEREAIVRIRRVEGFPTGKLGTVIYESPEFSLNSDDFIPIPVLHCDDLCNHHCKQKHVTYNLTVQAEEEEGDIALADAPITFTGTVFK